VILALVAVTAASWGIMQMLEQPEMVAVPNVVGQERAVAEQTLKDDGFAVTFKEEVADDPTSTDIGFVIDQTPDGKSEAEKGDKVELTVVIAPAKVTVEDVVGDQEDEATKTLKDQGLTVNVVKENSTKPSGEVLTQDPEAGAEVDLKSEVTLTVSAGGQATVPNVVGMTVELAESTLTESGFTVDVEYGNKAGTSTGVVFEQSHGANSTEAEGTTITITAQGVVVTWDSATTPAQLQTTLQGLGLEVTLEGDAAATTIESVTNDDGEITSGMAVAPGSSVTITAASEDGGGGGDDDGTTESPSEDCGALDPPPCGNGT
jgi:eukaryotic-like serine/threonine-protein kinase